MHFAFLVALLSSGALRAAPSVPDPCTVLKQADIQAFAGGAKVGAGAAHTLPAGMGADCKYTWGSGVNAATGLWTIVVTVGESSKQYPGMGLETLQEAFAMQTRPDPANASLVSGAGEAAVYTSGSPREVNMTAYVKGLILQIHLEGPAARAKKDQAIALLKTAATRL
jgi:hypothetical protein